MKGGLKGWVLYLDFDMDPMDNVPCYQSTNNGWGRNEESFNKSN